MRVRFQAVKKGSRSIRRIMASARGARNRRTRRGNREPAEIEAGIALRHQRKREREHKQAERDAMRGSFKVRLEEHERPRTRTANPHNLFYRHAGRIVGSVGTDARAPDGLRAIHYEFTARGFASTKGRRWRTGEAERAVRYASRAESLEGGEAGWWSNIARDRNELVGFFRVLEAVERHDRKNANVYISEVIGLDHTLSPRQRRKVVRRIRRYFEKRGLPFVAAIHVPDRSGDQRNFHVHILYSLRPAQRIGDYDWAFGVSKERDINTPDGILARRKRVVAAMNATLRGAGSNRRYTHLSNRARGLAPGQPKLGQQATWILRRLIAGEQKLAAIAQLRKAANRLRFVVHDALRVDAVAAESRRMLTTRIADIEGASVPSVDRIVSTARNLLNPARAAIGRNRIDAEARVGHVVQSAQTRLDRPELGTGQYDAAVERIGKQSLLLPKPIIRADAPSGEPPESLSTAPMVEPTLKPAIPSADTPIAVVPPRRPDDHGRQLRRVRLRVAARQIEIARNRSGAVDAVKVIAGTRLTASLLRIEALSRGVGKRVDDVRDNRDRMAAALFERTRRAGAQRHEPMGSFQRDERDRGRDLRHMAAERTPETDLAGPDPARPHHDPDPGRRQREQAMLRELLGERERAVLKRLRTAAWQRLAREKAALTLTSDGDWSIDDRCLSDDERRALHHPAYIEDNQKLLAAMHQRRNAPRLDAGPPIAPGVDPRHNRPDRDDRSA